MTGVVVFGAELGVMFALPRLLPADASTSVKALVDAAMLSVLCSPFLWFLLFQPLAIRVHQE